MTFELRSNGKIEMQIQPETEIETAFVKAFLVGAEKGAIVKIVPAGDSVGLVMRVEK